MNRLIMPGAVVTLAVLGGCALGPDYRTPESRLATNFENSTGNTQEPPREFWGRFDDPILSALVEDALKANHDVRIAVANLREARAARLGVDAQAYPVISSGFSGERLIIPQTQAPGDRSARTTNTFDTSIDANWELN